MKNLLFAFVLFVGACKTSSHVVNTAKTESKTEVLILIGSMSAANGGLHFQNVKGDTMFLCVPHPDSCYVDGKLVTLYPGGAGPELLPGFIGKKFMVTLTINGPDPGDDIGKMKAISAEATKMILVQVNPAIQLHLKAHH